MSSGYHVAIVGSGPSGFYAAEALLRSDLPIRVDMFERLPTPFGLVRSGVAPDHQKLKLSIQIFETIAALPGFHFHGNIEVGTDFDIAALRPAYDAVIFACGAQTDRRMGVPGEDLAGSHTATEFVGWYNGHPDYRDRSFDLQQEVVAIVGQGNVAADVCRILTRSVDELRSSDIAEHALDALSESRVREVHVIGRRGPAQAKFTTKELRELVALAGTDAAIDAHHLNLSPVCEAELTSPAGSNAKKNLELFRSLSQREPSASNRKIQFHFMVSPVEIRGTQRVEGLTLTRNLLRGEAFSQQSIATGDLSDLRCGLVFRSIGYMGKPISGLPFDARRGIIPNEKGRVVDGGGSPLSGVYVTGWIKRGPSGIIGTNKADSLETVENVIADLSALHHSAAQGFAALAPRLANSTKRIINLSDWRAIDAAEVERGSMKGKPREKFTRIAEMLSCCS